MSQNHLIILIPNTKSMIETISPVRLESQIALKEESNHFCTACSSLFHLRISSFILSNISIFASIAIPIDRTSPAILASVRTIPAYFKIAKIITT